MKKYPAEFLGTFVLTFMGCGSAIVLGAGAYGGHLAVAFAFGLSIVAMAYCIGGVSGCHINPAVSLSMFLDKRLSLKDFGIYTAVQVAGAVAAAGVLYLLVSTGVYDHTGGLGTNGVAGAGGPVNAMLVEMILTFIFILVILCVTAKKETANIAGIVIGLTLTFVHIVGIPLTGTSVNPARSIGPALFAGGQALADLWVFIAAPFAGAVLAIIVYQALVKERG